MVGAHISVSVLETPRTLDSFFPPVDETQPRRWAKALLRRQAAPKPRAARQSSATGRLPDVTLLAVPHFLSPLPPLVPLNEGHRSFPARLGVALVVPPWRQRGSWPILVCTRILRRLGSLQARSRTRYFPHGQVFRESWKTSGLLGFWKNCGRIVEEWGGRLSLPNIPRRESKIPVFFFRVVFRDGRCAAQPRILLQGGVSALVSGGTRAHKPSQERLERKTVPLKRKHHGVRSEPAEDNLGAFSGKHTVVWFLHTPTPTPTPWRVKTCELRVWFPHHDRDHLQLQPRARSSYAFLLDSNEGRLF